MSVQQPDVLVLAGGGLLGEAWMSALIAGLQDGGGPVLSEVDSFVGTSAGSIVAARLASGKPLRRPPSGDPAVTTLAPTLTLTASEQSQVKALGPFAPAALALTQVPGALLRGAALRIVPRGRRNLDQLEDSVDRSGVRFDGRLRVVCVDLRNGERVVFGAPDAPMATVGQAVVASCAIPGYFQPVLIGQREYVDGGVWSVTNIDAAPVTRGSRVLCLNPTYGLRFPPRSPQSVIHALMRSSQPFELAALERRGASAQVIGPTAAVATIMAPNLMAAAPAAAVATGGYAQGLQLARDR